MLHFACVQCHRRHKLHPSMAGATVRCPCGQMMLVPDAEDAPLAADEIRLSCVCGQEIWVPQSSVGQSVRCACGEELVVAGPVESPLEPLVEEMDDPFAGAAKSPELPWRSPAPPPSPRRDASASVFTNDLLRQAHQEVQSQSRENKKTVASELDAGRWTLIVIGFVIILINIIYFLNINAEITTIAQDAAAKGAAVDMLALTLIGRVFYGITILAGFVFIALGVAAYRFPVAAPAIGLSLYGAGLVTYLFLNPIAFVSPLGILVKIAIVGALVKAINSGIYYRH